MKLLNKKAFLLSTVLATSLFASSYEYPQVYKDTKIMGMAGVNVAIGGQASSLFYNTAGLSSIPKDTGWEVNVFNLNIALSSNISDFADDMDDATSDDKSDSEQTSATLDTAEEYLGKNLHLSTNIALLSVAKSFEEYSFGIMPIAGLNMNNKTHRGSGTDGIFETNTLVYTGVALGVAKKIPDQFILGYNISDISLGVGLKSIKYKSISAKLSVSELLDNKDDLGDYLDDTYSKEDSSTALDLGIKAKVYDDITAGISIQNIGAIAKGVDNLEIPMTLNAGLAYTKRFDSVFLNSMQVGVDYIDIFRGYKQDNSFIKRTRIGASASLVEGLLGNFALQAGLYQGHPSFGVDLSFGILKLAYTKYTEEIGAYSGQDKDERHMLQVSLGW